MLMHLQSFSLVFFLSRVQDTESLQKADTITTTVTSYNTLASSKARTGSLVMVYKMSNLSRIPSPFSSPSMLLLLNTLA